jgi:uncharacterized protein (TIGR03118 family)
MQPISRTLALFALVLVTATSATRASDLYYQTNLVTNDQSVTKAQQTDPNLINPWGFAFSTGSPLWVADQGTSVATVYKLTGTTSTGNLLNPPPPIHDLGTGQGPTGQVAVGAAGIVTQSTDFQVSNGLSVGKASFIFDNLDGSIAAWRGGGPAGTPALVVTSVAGASFTGLAIGMVGTGPNQAAQIYAADQNSNNVYIFNGAWGKLATSLVDPSLPAGFNAFNVQNIGGTLFVTYANPNSPTGGVVAEFNTDGTFIKNLVSDPLGTSGNGHLDTPWGLALAPAGWGKFGGDLLVGNNDGDGTINAYDLSGNWIGQIMLNTGGSFSEGELWGMTFGNGGNVGSSNVLYFAAGLDGATNGLIGAISPVPEPSSAVMGLIALGTLGAGLRWKNRRRRLNG